MHGPESAGRAVEEVPVESRWLGFIIIGGIGLVVAAVIDVRNKRRYGTTHRGKIERMTSEERADRGDEPVKRERSGLVKWKMTGMIVAGVAVAGVAFSTDGGTAARLGGAILGLAAVAAGAALLLRNRDAPWV